MSTILEALEKANKRKAAGTPQGNAAPASLNVANVTEGDWRERRLREEMERHRQHNRLLGAAIVVVAILLFIALYMLWAFAGQRAEVAGASSAPVVADAAVPAPAPVLPVVSAPTVVVATPTPVPVVEAPTPTPAATPVPTPSPTPEPTSTPLPTPTPERLYTDGEIVYDVDLGIDIEGVMKDGSQSVVLVDGEAISLGRKHKNVRPLSVLDKMVEAEVDTPAGVVVLYIRY